MWVIIIVSLIAFLLTLFESKTKLNGGMALGFFLITLVSAIRYDYGTDYMDYYELFQEVGSCSYTQIMETTYITSDVGWNVLCKFFNPLGFFLFEALLTVFMNLIYYNFIKENVKRNYYWLGMFIYLFTFDFYLLQMSMMRQALVIALFILSYKYIKRGKILIPLFLVLLSISFHRTAMFLIPFVFISKVNFNIEGKRFSIILITLFIVFVFSTTLLSNWMSDLLALQALEKYDMKYGDEEGNKIGIRMVCEFIPFVISMKYLSSNKTKYGPRYLVFLSTFSTILYPFSMVIHLFSRILFYFNFFYLATIPITYRSISNRAVRYSLLTLFMVITLYVYWIRFTDSVYTDGYAVYNTIFSNI